MQAKSLMIMSVYTGSHTYIQACFFFPGPPNFGLSLKQQVKLTVTAMVGVGWCFICIYTCV